MFNNKYSASKKRGRLFSDLLYKETVNRQRKVVKEVTGRLICNKDFMEVKEPARKLGLVR